MAGHENHFSRPEDYGDASSPGRRMNRQNKIQGILANLDGIQARYQPTHKPGSWSARYDSEGNSRVPSASGFPEAVKMQRKKAQRFLGDENIKKSIESLLYNDQIVIGNTRPSPALCELDPEPRAPSCKKKIFLENNNLSVPDASPKRAQGKKKGSVFGRLSNYSGNSKPSISIPKKFQEKQILGPIPFINLGPKNVSKSHGRLPTESSGKSVLGMLQSYKDNSKFKFTPKGQALDRDMSYSRAPVSARQKFIANMSLDQSLSRCETEPQLYGSSTNRSKIEWNPDKGILEQIDKFMYSNKNCLKGMTETVVNASLETLPTSSFSQYKRPVFYPFNLETNKDCAVSQFN